MALGMFTKIPVAHKQWRENCGPAALCWLPVIGLICGGLSACVYWVCVPLHPIGRAALTVLSFFPVCGLLHADGFMDVCDALMSSRPDEEKKMILKDSRVGAFSVISAALLVMVLFCGVYMLAAVHASPLVFLLVPAMSRAVCACAAFVCRPMAESGLMAFFKKGASLRHTLAAFILLAAVLCAAFVFAGATLCIAGAAAAALMFAFAAYASGVFGGINGDVLGFIIIIYEAGLYFTLAAIASWGAV